jgi:hypothetical protein
VLEAISALVIAGACGCSLLVDASDVDAGCPENQKFCDGTCVDVLDPAYGCTLTQCGRCNLEHATARCEDLICKVEFCEYGWGCPVDIQGCGVDVLSNQANCGYCGNACADDQVCRNARCETAEAQ